MPATRGLDPQRRAGTILRTTEAQAALYDAQDAMNIAMPGLWYASSSEQAGEDHRAP
jgi:hypothetical protein